jgi:hypothetical protein
LAEYFVNTLKTPEMLRGLDSADEALDRLWMRKLQEEYELFPNSSVKYERIVKRNKMLFKSLQEHTREKVRWESLEEWKRARNIAAEYSKELKLVATDIIAGFLSNQLDLKERLNDEFGGSDVPGKISDGVRETIWRGILTGEPDQMHVIEGANKWRIWIEFYKGDVDTRLDMADLDLAKEVLRLCHETVVSLRGENKSHLVLGLADQVVKMRERMTELEECLDPLILRPIILRTRCDLCPA